MTLTGFVVGMSFSDCRLAAVRSLCQGGRQVIKFRVLRFILETANFVYEQVFPGLRPKRI
jgi:hypothetical protein